MNEGKNIFKHHRLWLYVKGWQFSKNLYLHITGMDVSVLQTHNNGFWSVSLIHTTYPNTERRILQLTWTVYFSPDLVHKILTTESNVMQLSTHPKNWQCRHFIKVQYMFSFYIKHIYKALPNKYMAELWQRTCLQDSKKKITLKNWSSPNWTYTTRYNAVQSSR